MFPLFKMNDGGWWFIANAKLVLSLTYKYLQFVILLLLAWSFISIHPLIEEDMRTRACEQTAEWSGDVKQ